MFFNLIRILYDEWKGIKIKEPTTPFKIMVKNNSFDSFVKYELGWIL